MNFHELKHILARIQKKIPCRDCGTHFKDTHIRIIGTVLNEGYFMAVCAECKNKTLINVQMKKEGRKQQTLKATETHIEQVTADDVLDMRNFLKNFDGDFTHLFQKNS